MKKSLIFIVILIMIPFATVILTSCSSEELSLTSTVQPTASRETNGDENLNHISNWEIDNNGQDSNKDSIFPLFYLEQGNLKCISNFNSQPVQICADYVYSYAGLTYGRMKYYKEADILYYTCGYYTKQGIVYAELRQLYEGKDEHIADNVRIDSITFSENAPSMLYIIQNGEQSELCYRLRSHTELVDRGVYKGYFIYGYTQVIYLKDARGEEEIIRTLREYPGAEAAENPYTDYGLYYFDTTNPVTRIGNCGEIFSVNQNTGTVVAGNGTSEIINLYDSANCVDIFSINIAQANRFNALDNALMQWWDPKLIYEPINYIMTYNEETKERDLYRTNDVSCERIATGVINGRYILQDNSAYVFNEYFNDDGTSVYIAHTDGNQLFLPDEWSVSLENIVFSDFSITPMVYAIDKYDRLVKMYFYGEPLTSVIGEWVIDLKDGGRFIAYSSVNEQGSGYDIYIDDNVQTALWVSGVATVSQSGLPASENFWITENKTVLYITLGESEGSYKLNKGTNPDKTEVISDGFLVSGGLLYNKTDASQMAFIISKENKQYIMLINNGDKRLIEATALLIQEN